MSFNHKKTNICSSLSCFQKCFVLVFLSVSYFSLMLCDVLIYTQPQHKYALLSLLFMAFDSFLLPVYEKHHCIINSFFQKICFVCAIFHLTQPSIHNFFVPTNMHLTLNKLYIGTCKKHCIWKFLTLHE